MIDHVVASPLSRDLLEVVAQPHAVHRHVARWLPDLGGRSQSIRADTGTQYRVDLPTDPLGKRGHIVFRLRGDALLPTVPAGPAQTPPLRDGMSILVTVAAEKRLTRDGRITSRAVRDEEASAWAEELLLRHGLGTMELAVSASRTFGARGKQPHEKAAVAHHPRFSVRDLTATVTVLDDTLAAAALNNGIGRGRAYGLGMLVPHVPASTQREKTS